MGRYHIVTTWRVPGTVEEVAAVLGDVAALPRWWPSVYLAASVREPGDAQGVGKVVALRTKGWLPYTLAWEFRVIEVDPGDGSGGRVVLEPQGDLTQFQTRRSSARLTSDCSSDLHRPPPAADPCLACRSASSRLPAADARSRG